jgi:DNA-binding NarL/FixJ family response regulator
LPRRTAQGKDSLGTAAITATVVSPIRIHRESLVKVLTSIDGVEVIASVRVWQQLATSAIVSEPDVVIVDGVDAEGGPGSIEALAHTFPTSRVLVVGLPETEIVSCAEAGMAGYVTPEASTIELAQALEAGMRGELECPARVAASLARRVAVLAADQRGEETSERLTRREIEILSLLSKGFCNKEIASTLCIELATVKNDVHNLLAKLQLRGRAQAGAWYRNHQPELGHYGVATDSSTRPPWHLVRASCHHCRPWPARELAFASARTRRAGEDGPDRRRTAQSFVAVSRR